MSVNFVRHAFIAGELAPQVLGNTDLEKYDLGLALARNWYVDYRGGISTRFGTQLGDIISGVSQASKFLKFAFSPDTANTYILLFQHNTLRFIQDNAYVLEAAVPITALTVASPGVVTAAAHGYLDDDLVYIQGIGKLEPKLIVVTNKTTNTFELYDFWGDPIDTTGITLDGGETVRRVYTVDTPYLEQDLKKLRSSQVADVLRITHKDYPPYDLTRNNHADWTLEPTEFGSNMPAPTNVSVVASDHPTEPPGSACSFVVTAVDGEGNESLPSEQGDNTDGRNPFVNYFSYDVTWDPVPDAQHYNVYRTIVRIHTTEIVRHGAEFGYVGRSYGPQYEDMANAIPDFTRTPPTNNTPFANGRITQINVLTGGTGYTEADTVSITTSTGSDFQGYIIINQSGEIVAIFIENPGHDYRMSDTVVVTGGTGATFEIKTNKLDGNYPRTSAVFQQRQVYAATENNPVRVFGSQPGRYNNFDFSRITLESDEYEIDIDASEISPIKHLLSVRGGMLAMSAVGMWILSGENGAALTPKNPLADPQAYTGVSDISPLRIGTDILYVEIHSSTARLLSYKDVNKIYGGEDISYLSSHFFTSDARVESMDYAASPLKLVWLQRENGSILTFTILREQNVYGWTQNWTLGYFRDVVSVSENGFSVVYVAVDRKLGGRNVKTFERFVNPDFEDADDAWCLDCAIALPKNYPAADLQLHAASGDNVGADASEAIFGPDDVGKIIRAAGAKMRINVVNGDRQVHGTVLRAATKFITGTDFPALAQKNRWTMDPVYTTVSGLDMFNGDTVKWIGDGTVGEGVVEDGRLNDLPYVSRLIVGLSYTCDLQTLPIATPQGPIEGRTKRVVGVGADLYNARGLQIGDSFDTMYPVPERTTEFMGQEIKFQQGMHVIPIGPTWEYGAKTCIRQSEPLPATIRALVLDVDVGDDNS